MAYFSFVDENKKKPYKEQDERTASVLHGPMILYSSPRCIWHSKIEKTIDVIYSDYHVYCTILSPV